MTERAIFEAAIEITNTVQREAFLNEACAGDTGLRERLDVLLASHGKASQFLSVPAVEQIQPSSDEASSQTTMMPKSGTPQAPEEDDGDSERNAGLDVSFLQPSSKPGSIGLLGLTKSCRSSGEARSASSSRRLTRSCIGWSPSR